MGQGRRVGERGSEGEEWESAEGPKRENGGALEKARAVDDEKEKGQDRRCRKMKQRSNREHAGRGGLGYGRTGYEAKEVKQGRTRHKAEGNGQGRTRDKAEENGRGRGITDG